MYGATPQQALINTTGGNLLISGLCAGTYSNFVIQQNGCNSAPLAGPITLTDPNAPTGTIAGPAVACINSSLGSYSVSNLTNCASCTYVWTSSGGVASAPNSAITDFTFSTSGAQIVSVIITNAVTNCNIVLNYNVFVNGLYEPVL